MKCEHCSVNRLGEPRDKNVNRGLNQLAGSQFALYASLIYQKALGSQHPSENGCFADNSGKYIHIGTLRHCVSLNAELNSYAPE